MTEDELQEFKSRPFHWQISNGARVASILKGDQQILIQVKFGDREWRGWPVGVENVERPDEHTRLFYCQGLGYKITDWNIKPYTHKVTIQFESMWEWFKMENKHLTEKRK
jgi:hypothetical protein